MFYVLFTLAMPDKPQITQAITGLLGFTFLLSKIEKFSLRIPTGIIGALIAYGAWTGVSLLWTSDVPVGFYTFWRLSVVTIFGFIVWNIVQTEDDVAVIAQGYIFGAIMVFVSLYRNVQIGKGYAGAGSSGQLRYSAQDLQPNAVAWIFAFAISLAWMLIIWNRPSSKIFLPVNYAMPIIAIVGTLFTGSRGGAISVVLALGPIALYIWKRPIGAAILAGGLFMLLPSILVSDKLQGSINRIANAASSGESDGFSGRLDLWKAAIELALQNPFLGTGVGGFNAGSSELALNTTSGVNGAHQAFLAVLSETGIVGLVLFCILCYQVYLTLRRVPDNIKPTCYGLGFALTSVLMFSHQQTNHVVLFPVITLMAAEVVTRQTAEKERQLSLSQTMPVASTQS